MPEIGSLLLIEDEVIQRELVAELLRDAGYHVAEAGSGEEGLEKIKTNHIDLVLCDWKLPGIDGMQVFSYLRESNPDISFVMVSAYGTIARAVDAVRAGADDYLTKPFEREVLLLAVRRSLRARRLVDENRRLTLQLSERDCLMDMVGRAPGMQRVFGVLEKVAETDVTVLISGESGTGKELAARALHQLSSRKEGPFIAVNCATIPEGLADSSFFGVRKGAFTGASHDREGYFQAAQGGTLFLDEVGELQPELQAKLLRVLQEKRLSRVGDVAEIEIDCRLVVATNRNLEEEVEAGNFREDLYYRLAIVPVKIPPLRERREDLPLLIEHLTQSLVRRHGCEMPEFPAGVTRRLLNHPWPGNVRELGNILERLILLADDGRVSLSDFPEAAQETGHGNFELEASGLNWDEHEKSVLEQALKLARGNRTHAAKLLGMPYKAFLYRIEKHSLKRLDNSD